MFFGQGFQRMMYEPVLSQVVRAKRLPVVIKKVQVLKMPVLVA
jgi:hypothetical protein